MVWTTDNMLVGQHAREIFFWSADVRTRTDALFLWFDEENGEIKSDVLHDTWKCLEWFLRVPTVIPESQPVHSIEVLAVITTIKESTRRQRCNKFGESIVTLLDSSFEENMKMIKYAHL